jgi:hypothetical protein
LWWKRPLSVTGSDHAQAELIQTHLTGMKKAAQIALRGLSLPILITAGLACIGIVLYLVDWVIMRRMMKTQ